MSYNIANIYENLLKTNFNDKNRIFNMLLFIVNKAFAQADNFYYTSYNKIDSMLTGKKELNLKEAIFTTENAYFDGNLSHYKFENSLQQFTSFIKSLSTNKLISYNHTDFHSVNTHAAIFRMMTDTIPVHVSDTTLLYHLPFQYNFDDYAGKKNGATCLSLL